MSEHYKLIGKIRKILKGNALFTSVCRRMDKIGVLEVFPTGLEKYNIASNEEFDASGCAPEGPRSDSHYDVEGYSSVDLYGCFAPNLLNPGDFWIYIKAICSWIKESIQFGSWDYFFSTSPLSFPWTGWAWTIEALHGLSWAVASDQAQLKMIKKSKRNLSDLRRSLEKYVTREDILKWLESHDCVLVDKGLWVSLSDPTVFYVDEVLHPFDLKDGWSKQAIASLLEHWFQSLAYNRPNVRMIPGISAFSDIRAMMRKVLGKIKHIPSK
jgi:hypothetical protein